MKKFRTSAGAIKSEIKSDIYNRILSLCRENNYSLAEVATKCDLSLHVLYDWQKHITVPSLKGLKILCEFFNITMEDFFRGIKCQYPKDQKLLLKQYSMLNAEEKHILLAVAELIVQSRKPR